MSSRHNKYVSVTDWFATPASKGTTTISASTGIAASGASFSGGSWGGSGGSGGGQMIHIIKTNDTTPESNSNVYSALRVHDSFISKDKDERTSGKLASDVGFEIGEYVSGSSGAIMYVDPDTLQTSAELDRLRVRIKAYFETLEIVNVNSVGGKQIISPAGSIKCSKVEVRRVTRVEKEVQVTDEYGNLLYDNDGNPIMETIVEFVDNGVPEDTYRCYFVAEQDGDKVENRFQIGDLAYSKKFNVKAGESSQAASNYYWRLVTGVGDDYIDLSISDCDTGSDVPQAEDVICHLGSRTNNDRRNALEFSAVDDFSPSVTLYQGIGESDPDNGLYPYSFSNKAVVQYGVNRLSNRAFMNVYGDMYIGDKDENSFLRFDSVGGLTIKGNLSAGTTLGDTDLTLEQRIALAADAYKEDVNEFKSEILKGFGDIQNQIDGAIETYFLDPVPTLDNEPAIDWVTDEIKQEHVGDLYYDAEGNAYRFQYEKITNEDGSTLTRYYWKEISDTGVSLALAAAKKAQDTADSKRKIFVQQPKTNDSYDVGDMWADASYVDPITERLIYDGDLLRAVTAKEEGYPFNINHWALASKYTDDTAANAAQAAAEEAKTAANNAQAEANAAANRLNNWAADNVISPTEKQGIKEEYVRVLSDRDHINDEYDKYFLGEPTAYNDAYLPYITALIELFTSTLETVPIPSNFETLQTNYYSERTAALNAISTAAKKVADDAQAAADNALAEAERALTVADDAKNVAYDMNFVITGSTEYIRDAFADGIINKGERAAILNQVNQINTIKAQVAESYKEVSSNTLLNNSNELVNLQSSYSAFVTAVDELIESINDIANKDSVENIDKAVFENKYNNFNSKYSVYTLWLNACAKYIEYNLNTRVDATIEALGGYSYLKNALNNEKTTVTGGLVLTTMLALGYTDENKEYHINAGINGSAAKSNDIVIWAGGSNIDIFAEPNNPQAADFLVRGDGTGYAAGGNFWWDSNGIIHADPMSFVISEQSVGMLLASFQVYYDMNQETGKVEPYAIDPKIPFTTLQIASDLLLGDHAMIHFGKVKLGYDSKNNAVYFSQDDGTPVNLYATGGVSMYGSGNTSVTTIMDVIENCIDPNTLKVENGILTVIGGTGGGGILSITSDMVIEALGYTPYNSSNPSGYITNSALSGYQTKITSSNKLDYSLINGTPTSLPASDVHSWAKASSKPSYSWSEITSKPASMPASDVYSWAKALNKPSYSWSEITSKPTIPTNNNQLTNGAGYITSSASITGNAGSATKLQTARTIWGQSFDGTGNVDGKIKLTSWDSDGTALRFDNGAANESFISMYAYYGNAYTFGQTTNRFVIRHNVNGDIFNIVNGNVGIDTTSPSAKLEVNGITRLLSDLDVKGYLYTSGLVYLGTNSNGIYLHTTGINFHNPSNTWTASCVTFDGNGNMTALHNLLVNGGITMYSDQRKKTILNHVELSLKQIADAPLIEHYYNGDDKKTTHVGSIAQYWASMNDWFCKLDSEGYYTMEIQNAALASAISIARELDRYETKTDKAIKKLKKRICELEEEVERLKSA